MGDIYQRIEQEIPKLRRYARALTRDLTAADDLVQDCLARALGKAHLWQDGTNLRAWLFTILHNQHVNQVRRRVREGTSVSLTDTGINLTAAANQTRGLEVRDIERALARLPEDQRMVLVMIGVEALSYDEVATIMDVPVGTIRSRLSRGRHALRQMLDSGNAPKSAARSLPVPSRLPHSVAGLPEHRGA